MRAELERHERAVLESRRPANLGRIDSFDLSVPLARFGVRYRAPVKWLSAEIEVDAADGFELLDAWIRARTETFSARAGQFKVPFSAIEIESSFDLPMVRRGLVHDILVDELEVAGRRPGIALGARDKGELPAVASSSASFRARCWSTRIRTIGTLSRSRNGRSTRRASSPEARCASSTT